MLARSTSTVRCFFSLPPGCTVSRTVVPGLPLIFAVDTSVGSPAIDSPFTSVITSSVWMPAFSAGDPSNTLATSSPRGCSCTVIPTPSKRPLTDWLNSFASSGVR